MNDNFGFHRDKDGRPILLGEGASGRTYRGWVLTSTKEKIPAALKQFKEVPELGSESKHEASREYSRFGHLNHPNVVRYLRCFYPNNTPILASELIEGRNLFIRAEEKDSYDPNVWIEMVLTWGFQIACALEYLEKVKVIHRDIKPGNIMIADAGERAILIDFGLAKATAVPRREQSNFSNRGFVGTYTFAAPEQLASRDEERPVVLTHKADIYALGATLAYALNSNSVSRGMVDVAMLPQTTGLHELIAKMTLVDVSARHGVTATKEAISNFFGKRLKAPPLEPESIPYSFRQADAILPPFKTIAPGVDIAVRVLSNECADVYASDTEYLNLEATTKTLRRSLQGGLEIARLINSQSQEWQYRLATYEEWCVGAGSPIAGGFDRHGDAYRLFEDGREELEWLDPSCATYYGECSALALINTDDVPQCVERHKQWPKGAIRLIREPKDTTNL